MCMFNYDLHDFVPMFDSQINQSRPLFEFGPGIRPTHVVLWAPMLNLTLDFSKSKPQLRPG